VETLKGALEALGYLVEVAHDGPSALRTAEVFEPEIALLDIGLPVMDGYELAKRLRQARGTSRELHLVAITGYGQEADRQRSTAAGFNLHLVKPIDLGKLEGVVKELALTSRVGRLPPPFHEAEFSHSSNVGPARMAPEPGSRTPLS
jgi:CheY-like chemotaxis protein